MPNGRLKSANIDFIAGRDKWVGEMNLDSVNFLML